MRLIVPLLLLATPAWAQTAAPPKLEAEPVTDTYFGTKVEDRFRFVEKMEPATVAWMRAQGDYTRRMLDAIAPRAALLDKMEDFGGSFGFVANPEWAGQRLFYTGRAPGTDQSSLMVREAGGATRTLVDMPALIKAKGYPLAIDGFEPSRDGRFVAVRMSEKGSESSMMTVLNVASGRTIAGPVRMGPFTETSWDVDGKSLFFSRMPDPATTPDADRYKNKEILYWRFGSEPRVVIGARRGLGPNANVELFPSLFTPRGTDKALLTVSDGVANEFEVWEAPRPDVIAGHAHWRRIASLDDAVTGIYGAPEGVTFLTHKGDDRTRITQAPWSGTAAEAATILPAQPGIFYESLRGARDGVYVAGRERLSGAVWRIPKGGKAERLALPRIASIAALEAESDRDGALIALTGLATPDATYAYTPTNGFSDLRLETRPASLDLARYRVDEMDAPARDGAKVPLVVLSATGPRAPRPLILDGYGAYGEVDLPLFRPLMLVGVDAGVGYAQCGVRGGGELGEAWRLAGKGANKPNSWRDLIACAEKLIAAGYTTPRQLVIRGGSAGGITVGRAAIERPDLFAGAISNVGLSNPVRMEVTAAGAANANEFGSVKTEQGFHDLLAMDSYHAIRDGVALPPFLVTTGLEDPRVVPWQPAKFAARLQEAGNTALLRIDEQAGHGMGSTRHARTLEQADMIAFVLWRTGAPGWQPRP